MTEVKKVRYPKVVYKLPEPGTPSHQIVAGVCRALTKSNINGFIVANFAQMANNRQKNDVLGLISFLDGWVTVTGKEQYERTGATTQEETQATEPDVSSPT